MAGTSVFLDQHGARSFLTVSAHHPLGLLFYVHWNRRSGGKNFLKSTESIHCIVPIHFFELFPGPDLQKPDIPCYIAIHVIYVDRGQDKLRKSALKKCNVRIRLISKIFTTGTSVFLRQQEAKSCVIVLCHHPLGLVFYVHWNRRSGGKKIFQINWFHTLHFPNPLFRSPSSPRSTKATYIYIYIYI